MQGRVTGQIGIGIGAGVQQVCRQLVMSVRDRQEQRAGARRGRPPSVATPPCGLGRYGLVHVRPCLQQDTNDVDAALSYGKQQRRKPGVQTDSDIGAGLDELLRNLGVTFRRRPHQGRLSAPGIFTVNIGSAGQQRLHGPGLAHPRGRHQSGFPSGKSGVRVSPGLQEQLDHRAVSIRAGQGERRHAIPVRSFHVGARAHEQFLCFQIVLVRRPVQRRHPIDLRRVHIDALLQQSADPRPIHLFRRIRQQRGRTGAAQAARGQQHSHRTNAEPFQTHRDLTSRASDGMASREIKRSRVFFFFEKKTS